MGHVTTRAALGVFSIASILAVASSVNAAVGTGGSDGSGPSGGGGTGGAGVSHRWGNAVNKDEVLAVAGGIQCNPGHGPCWLNDGQQLVVWNSFTPDVNWWAPAAFKAGTISDGYTDQLGHTLCVGVSGASEAAGANLIVWPCGTPAAHPDQYWLALPAENYGLNAPGCFVFRTGDGQVMGVAGGDSKVANGAHVVQWPNDPDHPSALNQAWCPL